MARSVDYSHTFEQTIACLTLQVIVWKSNNTTVTPPPPHSMHTQKNHPPTPEWGKDALRAVD